MSACSLYFSLKILPINFLFPYFPGQTVLSKQTALPKQTAPLKQASPPELNALPKQTAGTCL